MSVHPFVQPPAHHPVVHVHCNSGSPTHLHGQVVESRSIGAEEPEQESEGSKKVGTDFLQFHRVVWGIKGTALRTASGAQQVRSKRSRYWQSSPQKCLLWALVLKHFLLSFCF